MLLRRWQTRYTIMKACSPSSKDLTLTKSVSQMMNVVQALWRREIEPNRFLTDAGVRHRRERKLTPSET